MVLKWFHKFFSRDRYKSSLKSELSELNQISFWIAGTSYEKRKKNILRCKISETVLLVREPDNEFDANAIHVKTKLGQSLGYVGKMKALELAPILDNNSIPNHALITELKCNLSDDAYGVKISLFISQEIYSKLTKKNIEISYSLNMSSHGNLYLLLDCDEQTLENVCQLLINNSMEVLRTGVSYRPAIDGHLYSWFIRLDNSINHEVLKSLLRANYPNLEEEYDLEFNREYIGIQENEILDLKKENEDLKKSLSKLESSQKHSQKQFVKNLDMFNEILSVFLPNVSFIGDSIDILMNEIKDFTIPLSKVYSIATDSNFKGSPIKSIDSGWFDIHFNTGQRDDGRIYFRKSKAGVDILVSFKKQQKKDIQFLSRLSNE